jgi:hypothetical protein
MSLTKTFAIGSGAIAAVGGAAGGLIFGMPGEAVITAAAGAATGAAGTSLLASGLTAHFDGKGPEAGIKGLFLFGAAHLVAVPVAAIYTAKTALKLTGLLP